MALPSTIYKVTVQLSDIDRGVYETLAATVAQHPSETKERLVARILAYTVFYEDGLVFTKGLCATDEPDIWLKSGDGRVAVWGEVGLPDADRIIKASRHAGRVVLLACGRALSNWQHQHLPRLLNIPNLTIITIAQPFITSLAERVERSIDWSVTITEGVCYLTVAGESLEASLQVLV